MLSYTKMKYEKGIVLCTLYHVLSIMRERGKGDRTNLCKESAVIRVGGRGGGVRRKGNLYMERPAVF
jgi:hypothetical protein